MYSPAAPGCGGTVLTRINTGAGAITPQPCWKDRTTWLGNTTRCPQKLEWLNLHCPRQRTKPNCLQNQAIACAVHASAMRAMGCQFFCRGRSRPIGAHHTSKAFLGFVFRCTVWPCHFAIGSSRGQWGAHKVLCLHTFCHNVFERCVGVCEARHRCVACLSGFIAASVGRAPQFAVSIDQHIVAKPETGANYVQLHFGWMWLGYPYQQGYTWHMLVSEL